MNYLHEYRQYEFQYIYDRILFSLERDINILDFGCGDGFLVNEFRVKGFVNTIGIDVYNSNYKRSELDIQIYYYSGNLEDFPAKGKFALIHSSNVLEHLSDQLDYLVFFDNYLEPNGFQVHLVPTHFWKFYNAAFYYFKLLVFLYKRFWLSETIARPQDYKIKQKQSTKESRLFIGRHGAIGSSLGELIEFNPRVYRSKLRSKGFDFSDFSIPLIYSGHNIFGSKLSKGFRRFISVLCGYSCHVFIIKKRYI